MTSPSIPLSRDVPPRPFHPLHALLLAGCVPLFLGVLLADLAYSGSDQIQWKNFASWLNAGGLVLCGAALLWAVVALVFSHRRQGWPLLSVGLLLAGWLLGFANSLVHAKDAAATMPEGLVLSVIVFALLAATGWLAFSHQRAERRVEVRA